MEKKIHNDWILRFLELFYLSNIIVNFFKSYKILGFNGCSILFVLSILVQFLLFFLFWWLLKKNRTKYWIVINRKYRKIRNGISQRKWVGFENIGLTHENFLSSFIYRKLFRQKNNWKLKRMEKIWIFGSGFWNEN